MAISLTRRDLIRAGAAGAVAAAIPAGRAPGHVPSRPAFTHGIQSGDVTADSAIVWARADRPSRMIVQLNHGGRRVEGPLLTPATDLTGKVELTGLPAGEEISYRRIAHGRLLDVFIVDMRTFKDPNDDNVYVDPQRGLIGAAQREWLKRELAASTATWKVIANDLPLGLVVPDTPGTFEGVAQGDPGRPLGRELEFDDVLSFAHQAGIEGTVFLTADVHYTAAHRYDPARAAVADFRPFWEFVSGPLNAGAFGPNALDGTFGPEVVFLAAPPAPNTSPADGFQFFGHVAIDGDSRVMTVSLRDLTGAVLFSTELEPPADGGEG